jgi:hypothetical protein
MPKCYECKFRGNVPGDAHSCCRYPGNETGMFDMFSAKNVENCKKLNIKASAHGVRMGWFMWPTNFDPTWLENCDGFEEKTK